MRVAHQSVYDNFLNRQATGTKKLNKVTNEISSGKKIALAQEDPNIHVSSLRLKNKINTLNQSHSVSQRAREFTLNSDTTLGQMTKALDQFKVKLSYAANEEHTSRNYEIIANELKAMKDHMMSLANTSVDGKYIFSGSKTDKAPISKNNSYQGNNEPLKALIGNSNKIQYNITGEDTFFGRDNDINRVITTNMAMLNKSKLHPDIMSIDNKDMPPAEVYINSEDRIRDLVGDNDDNIDNNANTVFYIKGRQSDGTSFKSKISLDMNDSVDTLIKRVEDLYDGSVDVKINSRGQFELRDNTSGQSLIDFHMFGAIDRKYAQRDDDINHADVDNINELFAKNSISIIDFNKSALMSTKNTHTIAAKQNDYKHNIFEFNTPLYKDFKPAKTNDTLQHILGSQINTILVSGTTSDGDDVRYIFNIDKGEKLRDLIADIKSKFGNVDVKLDSNGKLTIIDLDYKSTRESDFEIQLQAHNLDEETKKIIKDKSEDQKASYIEDNIVPTINAFHADESISGDSVYFKKDISKLYSNVSQIIKSNDEYANESTRLIDVAGKDLQGTIFKMNLQDINGDTKNFLVEFNKDSVVFGIDKNSDGKLDALNETRHKILNEKNIYTLGKMSDEPTFKATFSKNTDLDGIDIGDEVLITSDNFQVFEGSTDQKINFMHPTNLHLMKEGQEIIINGQRRRIKELNHLDIPKNIVLEHPLKFPPDFRTKVSIVNSVNSINNETKEIRFDNELPFKLDRYDQMQLSTGQIATSDTITYSQLMDTISMALSDRLPVDTSKEAYVRAVDEATSIVKVDLNQRAQIQIQDLKSSRTKMQFSISDINSSSFDSEKTDALSFNSNNSLLIDDAHVDFFNQLDEMISAVRHGIARANGNDSKNARNKGIQNSLHQIDHLQTHVSKMQTQIGIQTRRFDDTIARDEMLITHVNELKSDVEDTDIAEASMRLQQQSLGYQATLQTIQKMNGLSLVNYMR